MRAAVIAAVLPLLAASASAQGNYNPATRITAQKEAMKKITRYDGVWRGPAWSILPTGRHDITQTERIGPFLDGSLKVLEGRGYNADGSTGFNAFGTISFEPNTGKYNLHSYAQSFAGDFELKVTDTGYTWEVPAGPSAKVLYTATITDSTWLEVGDRIVEGQAPVRVFQMDLKRVGPTTWPASNPVSATGVVTGATRSADEAAIRFAEQNWVDVTLKGDANAFAAYLADQYIALNSSGRLVDKANWTGRIRAGTTKYDAVVLQDLVVRFPTPDIAVVTGTFAQTGVSEGRDNSGSGRYVNTWAKIGGRWQLVSSGFARPPK